jgi:antagonist of KipI
MGGFNGGFLEDDMLLYLNDNLSDAEEKIIPNFSSPQTIKKLRVILGPHENKFEKSQIDKFLSTNWEVTKDINRMGIKLNGDEIKSIAGRDMLSDGNQIGSIQITLKGEPIILLPDRGTIGGYPKIATIISADLDQISNLKISEKIYFESIDVLSAQNISNIKNKKIEKLLTSITKI